MGYLNPWGSQRTLAFTNLTAVSLSTASCMLRRNRVSRDVLAGLSMGGFFQHLTEFMMERSAACEVALLIFDTLTRIPCPAVVNPPHSTGDFDGPADVKKFVSWFCGRNAGVAHRSMSPLIHGATSFSDIRRPGCLHN